jgi:hypothetical protein
MEKQTQLRSQGTMNDEQVWTSILDGRFTVTVTRTAPHRGELTISDAHKMLHREPVDLMSDALSGPDICDVELWQERAIGFVGCLND